MEEDLVDSQAHSGTASSVSAEVADDDLQETPRRTA